MSDEESPPSDPAAADPAAADPAVAEEETPPPRLGPAIGGDRFVAVDVLRGVAVLGILAMNIYAFAMPFLAYGNPLLYGGSTGLDLATWFFTHIFFDQKFLPAFSMLFGAGLVMMFERAEERGAKMTAIYYRRNLWLLLFGLVHAYLIWFGDILVNYALLGLVIFFFRRRQPRTLLIVGSVLLILGLVVGYLMGGYFAGVASEAVELTAARDAGETLEEEQAAKLEAWDQGMRTFMQPTPEDVTQDIEAHLGSYSEIVVHRVPTVVMMQVFGFLTFAAWRVAGLMLIGMALMKWRVFTAQRSRRFYLNLLAWGYGLGLPLAVLSAWDLNRHAFDPIDMFKGSLIFNGVGSVGVALGHVAVVMLAVKQGWLIGFTARLAAVGRMAFTNYLSHSLLLTPIFYGYGLGLYGRIDRFAQMGVVLAVWALQLWWSPLWLRHFRFGPVEWLWRSLTYWRRQPMRLIEPQR